MNGAGHIRRATVGDAPAMSALIRQTVTASNAADYSAELIAHLLEEFAPEPVARRMDGRDVFVLCKGDDVIGTVSLGLAAGKLHSMFVHPDMQKQGYGRQLVAHLEGHAVVRGFEEIKVSSSLTAQGFYTRLGYESLGMEANPGVATCLMRKQIAHG